jgi:hypothetical protein
MSDSDLAAIARWPNVPACYGWLSLDRRGRWRLRGEAVSHAGLLAFLDRHYGSDGDGNWFVQNGPQRVFVALDYTPWVLRRQPDGSLASHTGAAAGAATAAFLDEEGNVLLGCGLGIGLLDDRDLPAFLELCRLADGSPLDAANYDAALCWRSDAGAPLQPLQRLRRDEVAGRFGFNPSPVAPA